MDESTAWTRDLRYQHVTGDVLASMIRDVRRLVAHPDLSLDRKLTAIASLADEIAPPPGTGLPVTVAALLGRTTRPATFLLEELAGEPMRAVLDERSKVELPPDEAIPLGVDPGTMAWYRTGILTGMYSGVPAARITSTVLPERLSPGIRDALDTTDTPLGKLLNPLGARREPISARAEDDGTVTSTAVLVLCGKPVAYATEVVTAALCRAASLR